MEAECIAELVFSRTICKVQKNGLWLDEIPCMKEHSNLFNFLLQKEKKVNQFFKQGCGCGICIMWVVKKCLDYLFLHIS